MEDFRLKDLTQLRIGETGEVIDILGGVNTLQKLESLGIRKGMKLKKISGIFMRGPQIVEMGRTKIALGYGIAKKILVKEL